MKKIICFAICASICICFFPYSARTIEKVYADGFNGATYEETVKEEIFYDSKDEQEFYINGSLPKYSDTNQNPNSCANVAGSIVLGYYDKTYNELIPNFSSARIIKDRILYATQGVEVQNTIDSLYKKMKTNTVGNGTTANGFKDGLKDYVNEKGLSITYSSVVKNEELDVQKYEQSILEEKPVVLFVSKYTLIDFSGIETTSGKDIYTKQLYGGDHVLVAYGVRKIQYFDDEGNKLNDRIFLRVATGYKQGSLGYILLDSRTRLVEGYEIEIFRG